MKDIQQGIYSSHLMPLLQPVTAALMIRGPEASCGGQDNGPRG